MAGCRVESRVRGGSPPDPTTGRSDGPPAGGLLEEQPLAPIRIVPKSSAFFDYQAKYNANDTEHRFDTGLPADLIERVRELAFLHPLQARCSGS